MKSIDDESKLGDVGIAASAAPRHTEKGHEACAYYRDLSEETNRFRLMCPHGNEATGGWYNEDFVNDLKWTAQALIGELDYDGPPMHQRVSMSAAIEKLRELSK